MRTLGTLPGSAVAWVAGRADPWAAWLADPERRPDAVAIATPAALHADHALAVLAAGLPVFIEKPVALALADAEQVRAAAHAKHLVVVVDHVHLFNPAWRALKARVPGAVSVESEAGNAGPFREDLSPLWDWGAHDVALSLDLFGVSPTQMRCVPDAEGNHRLDLAFPGGRIWRARVGSRFSAKTRRVRVEYPGGTASWDDLTDPKLACNGEPVPVGTEPALTVALREFLAAAAGGPEPSSNAALGVEVVRILAACGPAHEGGAPGL